MLVIKIAWRNLFRKSSRSLATAAAIGLGLSFFIFFYSIEDGMRAQLVSNATDYYLGHIQITAQAFQEEYDPKYSIAHPAEIAQILSRDPNIRAYAERVEAPAFLNSSAGSVGVLLTGIDPGAEGKVTRLNRVVHSGAFLQAGDDQAIVLGESLARKLELGQGDRLVATVSSTDGALVQEYFRVKGTIRTGSESLDRSLALVTLRTAQRMLSLGERVTTLVLAVDQPSRVDRVQAELRSKLAGGAYAIKTWYDLSPILLQTIGLFNFILYLIGNIVFVVIAVGVANTVLISVIERNRELGVLMAMGTSRGRIVGMIVAETVCLGLLGLAIGNILGLSFVLTAGATGIDFVRFNTAVSEIPGAMRVVYPKIELVHTVIASVMLFLIMVCVSVFPALRAARLKPAEAIRFV